MRKQWMSLLLATGLVLGASASYAKPSKKAVKEARAACKSENPSAKKKALRACVKAKLSASQ